MCGTNSLNRNLQIPLQGEGQNTLDQFTEAALKSENQLCFSSTETVFACANSEQSGAQSGKWVARHVGASISSSKCSDTAVEIAEPVTAPMWTVVWRRWPRPPPVKHTREAEQINWSGLSCRSGCKGHDTAQSKGPSVQMSAETTNKLHTHTHTGDYFT